jgi:hypothetical protein
VLGELRRVRVGVPEIGDRPLDARLPQDEPGLQQRAERIVGRELRLDAARLPLAHAPEHRPAGPAGEGREHAVHADRHLGLGGHGRELPARPVEEEGAPERVRVHALHRERPVVGHLAGADHVCGRRRPVPAQAHRPQRAGDRAPRHDRRLDGEVGDGEGEERRGPLPELHALADDDGVPDRLARAALRGERGPELLDVAPPHAVAEEDVGQPALHAEHHGGVVVEGPLEEGQRRHRLRLGPHLRRGELGARAEAGGERRPAAGGRQRQEREPGLPSSAHDRLRAP